MVIHNTSTRRRFQMLTLNEVEQGSERADLAPEGKEQMRATHLARP